ncbi:MAG: acyl-CoA dehydrogenase family protein [Planctomycetota bacterium]|jgi:alkylation response protein AidB-like acyl-CoA dehydrogenase|nr:acyl-CoA dehydrogenase family protein [Planctomycetota bacterium]MDP6837385.1 acyl-CoA dehydrogenase family protein [Planctomycetota bacterium]MDP6954457.1 acyl-CoA dehydrogenase family protein [Planctomycetota bacterium]
MDFELPEDLVLIRDAVKDYSESVLGPLAARHDRESELAPEVFAGLAELGLWGITIPEEYGGSGLPNLALCVALEELNRVCASTGVTVSVHNSLLGSPIMKYGSEQQMSTWLPRLASGECIGAYCLTEAGAGSDAAAVATTARRDGDDWILNGTKIFVTNGGFAGLYVVYARTDPEAPKAKGISAFLVPRDTPGLSIGAHEKKTGIRGSSTTEILLEDARVSADLLLGPENGGFKIALETLDGGRIGIASQALGIGRACLEAAIRYAKEREQFGRPIGHFQAVGWKLADMSTRLDAARLLVYRAASLRDAGKPCTMQAAQAKLAASTTANFCADECLQIHGGAGYTDDFPVERFFRDARITEIYEGATDIQRLVIARNLLA